MSNLNLVSTDPLKADKRPLIVYAGIFAFKTVVGAVLTVLVG